MAIYYDLQTMLARLCDNLRISTTETGVYGDSTARTAMLNIGAKDFIRKTRALKARDSSSITSAMGDSEYALSSITTFMMIDREGGVLFDGKEIPYKSMRQLTMDNGDSWLTVNPTWTAGTGTWTYASSTTITVPTGAALIYTAGDWIKWTQTTVKYAQITTVADTLLTVSGDTVTNATITLPYYSTASLTGASEPTCWYMRNRWTLGLYPAPSLTYNAKAITIHYIKRPADMSATTDTPFDADFQLEEYTEAPLLYATWKLLIRGRELEEAVYYQKQYEKMVNECNRDLATTDIENLKFTPIVYNSRR